MLSTQSGRELPYFLNDYGRSQQQSPKTFEDGLALRKILPPHPALLSQVASPPTYAFHPVPSPFEHFYGRQMYEKQKVQGETFNFPSPQDSQPSPEFPPMTFFQPSPSSPPPTNNHQPSSYSYSSTSSDTVYSYPSSDLHKTSFPNSDEAFIQHYLNSSFSPPLSTYPGPDLLDDEDGCYNLGSPDSSLRYSLPTIDQDQSFGLLQQSIPPPLWQQEQVKFQVEPSPSSSTSAFLSSTLLDPNVYPGQYRDQLDAGGSSQAVISVEREAGNREIEEVRVEEEEEDSHPNEDLLGEQTAFISKVWHLLHHSEYSKYLLWSEDGKAFVLINPDEFSREVLPRFFRHHKVTSFVRQLNLYSFQRVPVVHFLDTSNPSKPSSSTAPGFSHRYFQRGKPDQLRRLHPRPPVTTKRSLASRRAAAAVRSEEARRIKSLGGTIRASRS